MPSAFVVLANAVAGVALVAVGCSSRLLRRRSRTAAALALLPLAIAALLGVYVFGEDSYRRNGTSRWDAYRSPGGALGTMFVLSVGLMLLCAVVLAYAGLKVRAPLFRAAALGGGLTSLGLLTATIVGFTGN